MVNVIHDRRWAWRMIWIMWWRGLLTLTNDSRRGLAPPTQRPICTWTPCLTYGYGAPSLMVIFNPGNTRQACDFFWHYLDISLGSGDIYGGRCGDGEPVKLGGCSDGVVGGGGGIRSNQPRPWTQACHLAAPSHVERGGRGGHQLCLWFLKESYVHVQIKWNYHLLTQLHFFSGMLALLIAPWYCEL